MSVKHQRVSRYSDALVDPDFRIVGTHKGVEWVTDRYVMVRTDMFDRRVTPRRKTDDFRPEKIRDRNYRSVLGGVPREAFKAFLGPTFHESGDERTFRVVAEGSTAVLLDNSVLPLLKACHFLKVHKGRVVGFQHRPRSSKPVLVCVVQGVIWQRIASLHFEEVKS